MPPPTVIKTLMGTEYVKTCSTINCPPTSTMIPNKADPNIKKLCLYVFNNCLERLAIINPRKEIGPTMAVATAINKVTPKRRRRTLLS